MNFIKKTDTIILILSVVLMTIALYVRDILGLGIPKSYFIGLTVLPALLMSHKSLVYYIFFIFPLHSGLPGNYIFPLLMVLLLLKKNGQFDRNGLLCFGILICMELIHYVFYDFSIRWVDTLGYLTTWFFVFYLVTLKDDSVDVKRCILFFCFGLAVFLIAIFYITQIYGDVSMLMDENYRIGKTKKFLDDGGVMMLNANPNGLGFFAIVGTASIISIYFLKKTNIVMMALLSVVYLYVGALSISRTFYLCAVVMTALFLLFRKNGKGEASTSRYLMLVAFFAIIGYLAINNVSLSNAYMERFSNDSMSTAGGRTDIMSTYNKYLLDNPINLLIGTGAVHYGSETGIQASTHNGLQQILVSYGLIGFVYIMVITIYAVKRCYKKGFSVCLIPFIIAFLFIQAGQVLIPSHNLYMFIVSFFVMKLSQDTSVQKDIQL